MCHSNFQRYQYSRGSYQQRICDCATAQTGWWHALLMLWWLARCRDSRDEEWQRTTQQEGSANTQSGRYLRGEEALQEFFSVKICFICVYRPVVKVKAITWTSPPALRNVPKYAIKFFLLTETSSFVEGFQRNLCASLGSMKSPIWILTQTDGPQNPGGVVVLALINVPCKSSLSSDVKNDFCYPLSFLSCKCIRKGR